MKSHDRSCVRALSAPLLFCLFLCLSAVALPAQDLLSSRLDAGGFKKGLGPAYPLGRGGTGKPCLILVFHPAQASARTNLDALAALASARGQSLDLRALTSAAADYLERRLPGYKPPLGVETSSAAAAAYPESSQPVYVLLDASGLSLGVRVGAFDLASPQAAALFDALAAAAPSAGAKRAAAPAPATAQPAAEAAPAAAYLSAREAAVVAEINLARSDPAAYAAVLKEYRSRIRGALLDQGAGKPQIQLEEGASAVDEAIAFLERQKPLGDLSPSEGMSAAARFLAEDQARSGATGHQSSDGASPFDRLKRWGKASSYSGENCAYGFEGARDIVVQLIVDDGVASRGHRANIYNGAYARVGLAIASHPQYRFVCVMDFADAFAEGPGQKR